MQYEINEDNQQIPIGMMPIEGWIDIPCRIAAIIRERPTDDESRTPELIEDYRRRHLKLNIYAPDIDPREMVADVDGEIFEIRGVEHDSEYFSTRLRLEVLRPVSSG